LGKEIKFFGIPGFWGKVPARLRASREGFQTQIYADFRRFLKQKLATYEELSAPACRDASKDTEADKLEPICFQDIRVEWVVFRVFLRFFTKVGGFLSTDGHGLVRIFCENVFVVVVVVCYNALAGGPV